MGKEDSQEKKTKGNVRKAINRVSCKKEGRKEKKKIKER